MPTPEVIWRPSEDFLQNSNVARLMRKNNIADYKALVEWSVEDISRFWDAALDDLGAEWYRPYDEVLDLSGGFPWAKWFVGGETNICLNCIEQTKRDASLILGARPPFAGYIYPSHR